MLRGGGGSSLPGQGERWHLGGCERFPWKVAIPPALNFAHERAVAKMPFVRNSTRLGSCEKQVPQILSVGFFSERRGFYSSQRFG